MNSKKFRLNKKRKFKKSRLNKKRKLRGGVTYITVGGKNVWQCDKCTYYNPSKDYALIHQQNCELHLSKLSGNNINSPSNSFKAEGDPNTTGQSL